MKRHAIWLVAFVLYWGAADSARAACPMCKYANESLQPGEDSNPRPRAYMYSILFMLAVPASIFTGFSAGFYRLWKKQQELDAAATASAVDEFPESSLKLPLSEADLARLP